MIMDWLNCFDLHVMRLLNQFVGVSPLADKLIRLIADWPFLRCAPLVAGLWWLWFEGPQSPRIRIILGIAAVSIASLTSRALQFFVDVHPRPFSVARDYGLALPQGIETNWGFASSFPSDTTTLHFGLAAVIYSISRRCGILAFLWVAGLIAMPRVYLTYHWPSDIIAGALLGIGAVGLFLKFESLKLPSLWIVNLEMRLPQAFYAGAFLVTSQITASFEDVVQLARLML
jgi:undecaprenyl-diphosphatase